ncbi:hypothetical protein BaRGS_00035396 [Batillaria attramentaria]|uniref:RNA helicase n=1 Tax=Batillaria attramentaria TaxID=370345 RepID=A0ABD0JEI8_9CAEN
MTSSMPVLGSSLADSVDTDGTEEAVQVELDSVFYAELPSVLESLQPFLAQIGLWPTRLLAYFGGHPDFQQYPAKERVREIVMLERQNETNERAASAFVDDLLDDGAPPGILPHFMMSLLRANNHEDNPNEGLWRVHDVLTLACAYMPVQRAFSQTVATKDNSDDLIRTVVSRLSVEGLLTPDCLPKVLELLEVEGADAAVVRTLAFLYARQADILRQQDEQRWAAEDPDEERYSGLVEPWLAGESVGSLLPRVGADEQQLPRGLLEEQITSELAERQVTGELAEVHLSGLAETHTPDEETQLTVGSAASRPVWLDTLLDLVECCGGRGFRRMIPASVSSAETWSAVCDDDSSESGESEASDVTVVPHAAVANGDNGARSRSQQSLDLPRPRSMRRNRRRRRRRQERPILNIEGAEEIASNVVEFFHEGRLRNVVNQTERHWDRRNQTRKGFPPTKDKDETSSTSTEDNFLVRERELTGNAVPETADAMFTEIISDEITLRPYQEKLLHSAREGKNVMIVMPTGTGKTYVVLKYMQEFLSRSMYGRVMFLAPKIKLAEQQYRRFEHYYPTSTYFRCGRSRSSTAPFSELLDTNRVFVLTPQCLVEAIQANEVLITDFSLIVLDECHHAIRKHPYKALMDHYMDVKFAKDTKQSHLPQIIGLTASPGVGEGGTMEAALAHLKELCCNMDLEDICTVENENELKQYVSQPKHEIHTCKKRAKDGFRRVIESLMETIEDRMMTCSFVENHRDKDLLKMNLKAPEYHRTYQRYTHWLGKLGSYLVRMANDREAYSQFFSSAEMLRRYHQALILNEDCESQYALNYLLDQIREMEEAGQLTNLQRVVLDAADYNPKLSMLEGILGQIQEQHEDATSCMVFVRTLELSKAIKVWMEGHPDLKHLNPGRITGNSKPACDGGMSINAAAEVMKDFNMGKHKVVVCTSAAEEGLDFQACSAVIRYDYVTSMISMIQTRGRARRKDSQYFILGDETRGNVPREMIHLAAERLMNQAVETFQTLMNTISNQFRNEVRERQRREQNQRLQEAEMKKYSEEQRRAEVNGAVYNLYCRKCQRPACSSDEVRLYAVNTRMVISNDFQHKWKRAERKRPDQVFQNLRIVGKLHCRGCSFDWGCLARYIPTEKEFPVIKLDSFILENRRTGYKIPKKVTWAESPFDVQRITCDELETL